jgi:hypothetical protein
MANVSMNLGDKVIFDANDATNPSTTYVTNPAADTNPNNHLQFVTNGGTRLDLRDTNLIHTPSGRPEVRFGAGDGGGASVQYRLYMPNSTHKLLLFAGSASPWQMAEFAVQATDILLEGNVQVKARGTTAGDVSVAGEFKYADAGGRTKTKVVFADRIQNVKQSSARGEVVWWSNSSGSTPAYYARLKDQSLYDAQFIVPLDLPDGVTITGWEMHYRKVAQAGGKTRTMQADLAKYGDIGTTWSPSNFSTLDVVNGDGSTETGTKSATGLSEVVANGTTSYFVIVTLTNNDTANGGPDGLGLVGFRLTYKMSVLQP